MADAEGLSSEAILAELFESIQSRSRPPAADTEGSEASSEAERQARHRKKKAKKHKRKSKRKKDDSRRRNGDEEEERRLSEHSRDRRSSRDRDRRPTTEQSRKSYRSEENGDRSSRRPNPEDRRRSRSRHRAEHDPRGHDRDQRLDRPYHPHSSRPPGSFRDSRHSRESRDRQECRAPIRRDEDDTFWESTWDAMELQKRADRQERKGRHYLERAKERTPTLSPSPKRRSPSPDCEELRRLKKLKAIQELVVMDSEKYVAVPPDRNDFEYDDRMKMWRRKIPPEKEKSPAGEKSYDKLIRDRMEEQFKGTKATKDTANQLEPDHTKKSDSSKLTLDEIEEIRKKREKFKKEREKKVKEDGEIESDEDRKAFKRRSPAAKRSRSRRSRSRDNHTSRRTHLRGHSPRRFSPRDSEYHRRPRTFRRSRSRSNGRRDRPRSSPPRDSFRGSKAAIDKEKLLAIAKKNAVKLLSSDNLMGMDHGKLLSIKSGGQSLNQLTDFCRELAAKGITDEFSDDGNILPEDQTEYHHPFMVKDRPVPSPFTYAPVPGSSLSATGLAIEYLNPEAKAAAKSHRMLEFPVSSGNAHRVKEVTPPAELPPPVSEPAPVKPEPSKPEPKPEEPEEALKAVSEILDQPKPDPVTLPEPLPESNPPESPPAPKKTEDSVFEEPTKVPTKDIGNIVNQRLDAMRKLTDNPQNPEALAKLYDAQNQMSNWAASKNKPGQFTGHTGAKILSKAELCMGIQAWAKQEQFAQAKKVSGGFGEFMLKKMGWQEGEGLGKDKSGEVDPLTLDIKHDKRGLTALEEDLVKLRRRGGDALTLTACKDLSGKHPVSALMELATKRRWGPPNFVQALDCGPSHNKQYIFKVVVNGVDYQPTIASDNKKKAKSDAASVALIELGLLPRDPNNPL
eukprot:maker-scaffold110_size354795-snap-gene-2.25 protein:Tk03437 transcript:maker-scaffold110_size354795-snap-gene-2.25-mRNA-1 annotation:"conserved hypothetical protein"